MAEPTDTLGGLLVERGVLNPEQLEDVVELQRHVMPVASLCYVLGYATEEQLASALWQQLGVPMVVLDRSVIALHALDDLPYAEAVRGRVLPLGEDDDQVFVAAAKPTGERLLRELEFRRGKQLVVYAAVEVCLDRAIRICYAARKGGAEYVRGAAVADAELRAALYVIGTQEHVASGEFPLEPVEVAPEDLEELEDGIEVESTAHRVLVVDDETVTRRYIMRELAPLGVTCVEAWSGLEAIKQIKRGPFDLVVSDIMLPEINGFQVCRTIKQSSKYRHIRVLLMSANLQSGQVDAGMLAKYGADGFLDKPVHPDRLRETVRRLLDDQPGGVPVERSGRQNFQLAVEAYKRGHLDAAIALLRDAIAVDPLSPRAHLMLGDLLRDRRDHQGAVRAYETAVRLEPEYLPSLDRLGQMYYRTGFLAKAAEAWRRALRQGPDPQTARRIEGMLERIEQSLDKAAGA